MTPKRAPHTCKDIHGTLTVGENIDLLDGRGRCLAVFGLSDLTEEQSVRVLTYIARAANGFGKLVEAIDVIEELRLQSRTNAITPIEYGGRMIVALDNARDAVKEALS